MKEFLGNDFLLKTPTAVKLYEDYAKNAPIFDFHCHLSVKEIYEDKKFSTITEAWLGGDHYKWRLMREAGVDESYVTGNKPDYEKFLKYAEVMPYFIGNPVYHWTHLELKRFFGIDKVLSPLTAKEIYDEANEKLKTLTARKMMLKANVKKVFTTDDPVDDLKYHKLLAEDKEFGVEVKPAFRPDKLLKIGAPGYLEYVEKLSEVSGVKIDDARSMLQAVIARIDYFDKAGCVCSDQAPEDMTYCRASEAEANAVAKKLLDGKAVSEEESAVLRTYLLVGIGKEYKKRNWVMQYHVGALRNNSARAFKTLGPDTGFDSIADKPFIADLSHLLSDMDEDGNLPKTILYCLNPRDNEVIAALMNCFQDGLTAGKIQFGSAWWFNDQKDGILRQLNALSHMSLVSYFVGMLTDSRSFLSYTRHEYFRRVLCNFFGDILENGEYPYDIEFVGKIVRNISYDNAIKFFEK